MLPRPQQPARRTTWRRSLKPYLFLAPLLLLNFVVVIVPSILAIRYAFTDWSGIGEAQYVGLANFQEMLTDRVYWRAIWNNIRWTLIFLTVPVSMGLLGAALLIDPQGADAFSHALFHPLCAGQCC